MADCILIAPTTFCVFETKPTEMLEKLGLNVIVNPKGRKLSEDEIISFGKKCVGVIAGTEKYTQGVMRQLPQLRVISRLGVGMDNVDIAFAEAVDVRVFRTQTTPALAVAELTLGFMIDLSRNISAGCNKLKCGLWEKQMGFLLRGKTLGIIGLGTNGKALAKLAQGFHFRILAFDIHHDHEFAEQYGVRYCDLETLLEEADIISINLSLSSETYRLIDTRALSLCKSDAILINTSRGEVIDEEALYHALNSGALCGAGLDVFEQEPYNGILSTLENVITTPHIGAYAKEIRIRMEMEATVNLIQGLNNVE